MQSVKPTNLSARLLELILPKSKHEHSSTKKSGTTVIIVAFESPPVIKKQMEQFEKFNQGPEKIRLVVVDNSISKTAAAEIKAICKRYNTDYFRIKHNEYSGTNASASHGYALNWAVVNIASKSSSKWLGFMDHDVFLLGYVRGLREKLTASTVAYGVVHKKGLRWYMWPGFCFINTEVLNIGSMDFMPVPGLDTGGGNWDSTFNSLNKADVLSSKVATVYPYGGKSRNKQRDAVQIIDGLWLHLINASNWAGVDMGQKVEKLGTLIETLTIKDKE